MRPLTRRPGEQLTFVTLDVQHEPSAVPHPRNNMRTMMTKPLPPSHLPPLTRRNGKWVGRPFNLDDPGIQP